MTKDRLEDKEVGQTLEELVKKKGALPERVRKDLEAHMVEYHKLILKMAHRYVRTRVEYPDLVQEALYGLMLAERDFDPKRSTDFHTYAITRMKGKMYEYCIANDSPIYIPTHVAKAASYVKQMRRLLENEPVVSRAEVDTEEIILQYEHKAESLLAEVSLAALREIKRKLERISINSKMTYERLAGLALKSLSSVVNDEVLMKVPRDGTKVEEIILGGEIKEQIKDVLGEKRLIVLEMRSQDWTYREIAEKLFTLGYKNKSGGVISRQAVKGIWDEALRVVQKSQVFKTIIEEETEEEK